MKDEVARYVQSPDDAEARRIAGDGLNEAIRELDARRWSWMETSHDITLSASTATYAVPANYKDTIWVEFLDSGGSRRGWLDYQDPITFLSDRKDDTSDGTPEICSVVNSYDSAVLTLDVPVSSSFASTYPTLRHYYWARVQIMVADSDTVNVPTEVESFILWKAKAYMAAVYDTSKYQIAEGKAEIAMGRLRADDVQQGHRASRR